jgi:UPF0755 protein
MNSREIRERIINFIKSINKISADFYNSRDVRDFPVQVKNASVKAYKGTVTFTKQAAEYLSGKLIIIRKSRLYRKFILRVKRYCVRLQEYLLSARRFSKKKLYISVSAAVIVVLFILSVLIYTTLYSKFFWSGDAEKRFTVKSGSSLTTVAGELSEQGIVRNGFLFKIYAKLSGAEGKIIPRNYVFQNGMNSSELLSILTNQKESTKFRVPEGATIKQLSILVEKNLQLSSEKFKLEAENDSLINILGLKGKIKNLEGFLSPDTYFLPAAIDEGALVKILFDEFLKKIKNDAGIQAKLKESKKDILYAVTLGSIIEAETAMKSEMATISGVYTNRLKIKMKLQADPTIQYALPGGPKPRLLNEDLKVESPYNTYKYSGLPPGPINNPGLEAIKSALFPEKHKYLYFVATGSGGHKFSETYAEHQKAAKLYRDKLDSKIK